MKKICGEKNNLVLNMAAYENLNIQTLREWAPLTDLFNKLPMRVQNGFFTQDVKLTCIDVLPEFIALGTNVGIVYWYDRKKKDLQRLRCEKQNTEITVVRAISTVDYMVACGNKIGSINIFQIPKSHPESIPESLKPKNKQVERYTVSDLHKSAVTSIEWSKNGMKLFSGDKSGSIVLTEIDFYMHICKSQEILNETYEVVQISYNHQRLLVSTTYRSIICEKQDKWKVCQVGKKDRKILGNFGGIIYHNGHKVNDVVLYCSRPRLRLWISDCEGNVNKTLIFKDLLSKECVEVPVINPISKNLKILKPQKEPSFGPILPFSDNLLLTYSNDVIYILNPDEMTIISTMSQFRNVLWVATCKDEIFVLEEERSLVRVSYKPEPTHGTSLFTPQSPDNAFLSIKDLTTKLQSSTILPAISPFVENSENVDVHIDNSLIMNAEEAKESPVKARVLNPEIEKKFNDIGKQQFNDTILYKQNRPRKKNVMSASTSSLSSSSSEDKDVTCVKPTLMNLSSVGFLPDLRSPESIQNDIEYKEKILADVLNLDKVKIPLDKMQETCPDVKQTRKVEVEPPKFDGFIPKFSHPKKLETPKTLTTLTTSPGTSTNKRTSPPVSQGTPACRIIPNEWKLTNIQLNSKNDTSFNGSSDNSLADWEII